MRLALLVVASSALIASACTTTGHQSRVMADEAYNRCAQTGLKPGSKAFNACTRRVSVAQQRELAQSPRRPSFNECLGWRAKYGPDPWLGQVIDDPCF